MKHQLWKISWRAWWLIRIFELIPYLLQVIVAVVLVLAVFRLIGGIARVFCDWRWCR